MGLFSSNVAEKRYYVTGKRGAKNGEHVVVCEHGRNKRVVHEGDYDECSRYADYCADYDTWMANGCNGTSPRMEW